MIDHAINMQVRKTKMTTVPGPLHNVVQVLVEFHIRKGANPSKVETFREYPVDYKSHTFRADVLARYLTSAGKKTVIYEVQDDVDAKAFVEKMKVLGTTGEIIPLNRIPQHIRDAIDELSDIIEGYIVLPPGVN